MLFMLIDAKQNSKEFRNKKNVLCQRTWLLEHVLSIIFYTCNKIILSMALSLYGAKQALIERSYLVISTTVLRTDHLGIREGGGEH